MTRVRLHEEHEVPEPLAALYREIAGRRDGVPNLHKTLAGAPDLFEARLAYSNALRSRTKLDKRWRELAIMLVARLTRAEYEFTHHWKPAIKAGLTAAQLEAIGEYRASGLFDARDLVVLDLAREMTLDIAVSDATWAAAATLFDEQELIELVLTIGWYNQTSRVLAALRVPLEAGYSADEGYGKV